MNVAVYIDWQNIHNAARRAFGLLGAASEEGQVDPYRLARIELRERASSTTS